MHPILSKIFTFENRLVMLGWLVLICLPSWEVGKLIVVGIILTISATYAFLLTFGSRFDLDARPPSFRLFGSLKGVMALFKNPRVSLTAWLHFLAFDLLIGLLILNDSQQLGIYHWFMAPILVLSMMIGPAGLLIYLCLRLLYAQSFFGFFIGQFSHYNPHVESA